MVEASGGGGGCAHSSGCACACAGGGRAGCSKKDFYGTKLSYEKVKKELEKGTENFSKKGGSLS